MRRAQIWSIDFAASLVLFFLTMLIAYTLITNTLTDKSYDVVRKEANNVGAVLAGEGFPVHWTNTSVIRAGLSADGFYSMRKGQNFAKLSADEIRTLIRATDNYYIYFTNISGGTVPILEKCGVGDITVAVGATPVVQLPAMALARGSYQLADKVGAILYDTESGFSHLDENDIVVIEGNLSEDTTLSSAEIGLLFDRVSRRGVTFIVIGDPGVNALGIDTYNTTTYDLAVQGWAGSEWGFNLFETLNVSGALPANIRAINVPAGPAIDNYKSVALSDGADVAYATWTYHDSRVWYFATVNGERSDDSDLNETFEEAIEDMIDVEKPECAEPNFPTNAKHIVHHDRTLLNHDEVLNMRVVIWRMY